MSRGTTRRIAFGRRTRTVPNSSRSVTKARPSGPPSKPPLRLRSTRVIAPGGGASGAWTHGGRVAGLLEQLGEARRLVRGEDDPRAVDLPALDGLGDRAAPPGGELRLAPAEHVAGRQAAGGERARLRRLRFPRELERPAGDQPGLPRPRPDVGRGPVLRQLAALDQLGAPLIGLAPEEVGRLRDVARLVEDEEGVGRDVVEAARRREERRPDLRGVADVQRPRRLARLEPLEVGGEALRQLGRLRARAGPRARPDAEGTPTRGAGSRAPAARRPAGRSGRTPGGSRSRRRRTRSGPAARPTAGRRRRCRRAARTRRGRRPRRRAHSRGRAARGAARPGGGGR